MKILVEPHCHTIASGHAYSTVTECFEEASKKGLKGLAITEHSPKMPGTCDEIYFINLKVLPKEMYGVRVYKGVELNILNREGEVDLPSHVLGMLDYSIASLHGNIVFYRSKEINTKAYINALNNPYIKIIGHPGDPAFPFDIKEVVAYAKKKNKALEINEQSCNPNTLTRSGGYDNVLEIAKECVRQGTYMVIGGDTHFHTQIGEYENAIGLVKEAGVPEELILNTDIDKFEEVMGIKN